MEDFLCEVILKDLLVSSCFTEDFDEIEHDEGKKTCKVDLANYSFWWWQFKDFQHCLPKKMGRCIFTQLGGAYFSSRGW